MAAQKLEQQKLLQVRSVQPELIRQLNIYSATHGMTNGEVITKALQLLFSKEQ